VVPQFGTTNSSTDSPDCMQIVLKFMVEMENPVRSVKIKLLKRFKWAVRLIFVKSANLLARIELYKDLL